MNQANATAIYNELFINRTAEVINNLNKADLPHNKKVKLRKEVICSFLINIESGPLFNPVLLMSDVELDDFYFDTMDHTISLLQHQEPAAYKKLLEDIPDKFPLLDTVKPIYEELLRRANIET